MPTTRGSKSRKKAVAAPSQDEGKKPQEVAPGFKYWKAELEGSITQVPKFYEDVGRFGHNVTIFHKDAFTLKPLTISQGALKGRHVLLLEPFKDTDAFDFMGLAPEIRQLIYELLFEDDEPIKLTTVKAKRSPRRAVSVSRHGTGAYDQVKWVGEQNAFIGGPPSSLNLLAASKQLLKEAAPVIYGNNSFEFYDMSAMQIFLEDAGSMRKHLRYIALDSYGYKPLKARSVFNMLRDAKDLQAIALSHRDVCHAPLAGGHGYTPRVNAIAADCTPMMAGLLHAQKKKKNSDAAQVLDILQVYTDPTEMCGNCKQGNANLCSWRKVGCKTKCVDVDEDHFAEVQDSLRKIVAKKLGLEVLTHN